MGAPGSNEPRLEVSLRKGELPTCDHPEVTLSWRSATHGNAVMSDLVSTGSGRLLRGWCEVPASNGHPGWHVRYWVHPAVP